MKFCGKALALVNHDDTGSTTNCVDPHHRNTNATNQTDAKFIMHIGSHLTEFGCLQFHPFDYKPICLDVYNLPLLWESSRVTHYNQYSSDCDDDSLVKPLCDYGSSECFSADRICTFERDIYGDPVHCSDTEHLRYCASHQCPDAFKCDGSYCIPVHMVCDTILDCPDGDDEAGCENPHIEGILFWYVYFNFIVDESLLLLCYECYHSGV